MQREVKKMPIDVEIKKAVEKKLRDLPDDFIVAVISSPEKYSAVNIAITRYLTNKRKLHGIYITMNKPYKALVNVLKENGVDVKKLFFVDAISGVIGEKRAETKNCVVLRSPSSLTELGIVISKVCDSKKSKFVMMDSLSTILVYNSQKTTVRFVHYVVTQLRKCAWPGVIFSLEKDMEGQILESITQFCDRTIRV